ncbi:MAG: response regulator, partial [Nitrospirales bacterium]
EILLIEDNDGDVRLAKEALKEVEVRTNLSVVNDGETALAFLHRENFYADALRPDLILLDLNLPKKSGHEVLTEVKTDEDLMTIPIVVLSSSARDEDVLKAHDHFANCYVTKPSDIDAFWAVIKSIVEFWLIIVKIPAKR